jgi:hypothetical protein
MTLRDDSSGNGERRRARGGRPAFAALLSVVAVALGWQVFAAHALPTSPRAAHGVQSERRELHLRSSALRADAERRCAWPNAPTGQVTSTAIYEAAARNRARLFGDGLCNIASFVVGDLDADGRDDVVAEIWCSLPSDQSYEKGLAVFSGTSGRGLTLASVQEYPFGVTLERLCDGVLTVEVGDRPPDYVARLFGAAFADDASHAVNLRLRSARFVAADARSR